MCHILSGHIFVSDGVICCLLHHNMWVDELCLAASAVFTAFVCQKMHVTACSVVDTYQHS